MAQHFAPKVIVLEMAYRDTASLDARLHVRPSQMREMRAATWEAVRQAQLENQAKRWQLIQAAKKAQVPPMLPPAPRVFYLPRAGLSDQLVKFDPNHCSMKFLRDGAGDGGIRSPFCYPLVQGLVEMMCDSA